MKKEKIKKQKIVEGYVKLPVNLPLVIRRLKNDKNRLGWESLTATKEFKREWRKGYDAGYEDGKEDLAYDIQKKFERYFN